MGSRSKGGYKCELNRKMSAEAKRQSRLVKIESRPVKVLVLSRFRLRTRKYRKIR